MIPPNKTLDIPTKVIKRDNVDEFWANLKELLDMGKTAKAREKPASTGDTHVIIDGEKHAIPNIPEASKKPEKPKSAHHFAFVVNVPNEFWNYARAGCYKAEQDFGILCDFKIPHDGSSAEQNRILETLIQKDEIKGIAVSPLDPKNQTALLNKVADEVDLLCHDSDAPDSNRLFYLGTNNYLGGRQVGKLVKEALPDGGKLMIFVGKLDVLNAQQRRQGVIDELMDKSMPQ